MAKRPTILVSNDDSIHAAGIHALRESMQDIGDVWVVAPSTEQSAVSHAISLRHPLRVIEHEPQVISVSGTPADCIYVALNHILKTPPDLCVSGINHGANLGDDVIYSGTVACAVEATNSDVPAIAFSMAGYGDLKFDGTTGFTKKLATMVLQRGLPRGVFLNANMPPDIGPHSQVALAKLGRRNYGRIVIEKKDPRNKPYYWLGGAELGFDDIPGSDCNAVAESLISVTPVHLDITHYAFLREMQQWKEFDDEGWL